MIDLHGRPPDGLARSDPGDERHIGHQQQAGLAHQRDRQAEQPGEQVGAGDHHEAGRAAGDRVGEQGKAEIGDLAKHDGTPVCWVRRASFAASVPSI